MLGWDDDFVRKYESNTPSCKSRLKFLQQLRTKGFWCSIRIQPLIDLSQAIKLVENAGTYPSYITVEHLKIPADNVEVRKLFIKEYQSGKYCKSKNNMRNIELSTYDKRYNIDRLKSVANGFGVLVGVGDNDLHYMSQSRCCCGIDTINSNFDNYLKYNTTYLSTGDYNLNDIYVPKNSCYDCFFSTVAKSNPEVYSNFKNAVEDYIRKYPNQLGPSRCKVEKDIFGITQSKLF
jgi:hypothetical protein